VTDRPSFIKAEHLLTLDFFKASGKLSNGNAITELQRAYPELSEAVSRAIVAYWLTKKS
jgi:hypothetical protein